MGNKRSKRAVVKKPPNYSDRFKLTEKIVAGLSSNDVLLGRGSTLVSYEGNVRFRYLVWQFKDCYSQAKKAEKSVIVKVVLDRISNAAPPGRFMERDGKGIFRPVEDVKAYEKTCQALREKKIGCPKQFRQGATIIKFDPSKVASSNGRSIKHLYRQEEITKKRPKHKKTKTVKDSKSSTKRNASETSASPPPAPKRSRREPTRSARAMDYYESDFDSDDLESDLVSTTTEESVVKGADEEDEGSVAVPRPFAKGRVAETSVPALRPCLIPETVNTNTDILTIEDLDKAFNLLPPSLRALPSDMFAGNATKPAVASAERFGGDPKSLEAGKVVDILESCFPPTLESTATDLFSLCGKPLPGVAYPLSPTMLMSGTSYSCDAAGVINSGKIASILPRPNTLVLPGMKNTAVAGSKGLSDVHSNPPMPQTLLNTVGRHGVRAVRKEASEAYYDPPNSYFIQPTTGSWLVPWHLQRAVPISPEPTNQFVPDSAAQAKSESNVPKRTSSSCY